MAVLVPARRVSIEAGMDLPIAGFDQMPPLAPYASNMEATASANKYVRLSNIHKVSRMLSIGKNTPPAPSSSPAKIDEDVEDVRTSASNTKMTLQRVENVALNGEPSPMDCNTTQTDAATALRRRSGIDRVIHDLLRKAPAEQLSRVARFAASQWRQPASLPDNASFLALCSALHHLDPGKRTSNNQTVPQQNDDASIATWPGRVARVTEIDKFSQADGDNLHSPLKKADDVPHPSNPVH